MTFQVVFILYSKSTILARVGSIGGGILLFAHVFRHLTGQNSKSVSVIEARTDPKIKKEFINNQ